MAIHVAELYAALVAQRRALFAALAAADPAALVADVGLDHGSVLGTLVHCAQVERRAVQHTLGRRADLAPDEFVARYLDGEWSLPALERGWARVADEMRTFIRTEKPYELVFPRKDLGPAGGTPEQVLWHVMTHELLHTGELVAVRRQLGVDLPPLAPLDALRRNPELGRWWMAEQY